MLDSLGILTQLKVILLTAFWWMGKEAAHFTDNEGSCRWLFIKLSLESLLVYQLTSATRCGVTMVLWIWSKRLPWVEKRKALRGTHMLQDSRSKICVHTSASCPIVIFLCASQHLPGGTKNLYLSNADLSMTISVGDRVNTYILSLPVEHQNIFFSMPKIIDCSCGKKCISD